MRNLVIILSLTGLMSCKDFTIAESADHFGTGTINEPGTAVNPQPGVDLYEEINRENFENVNAEDRADSLQQRGI
ncbi:MAG: hypothetical protein J7604_26445 [Sporocytophaga sp.]|uniref:hypothetical protein n=1 Tax=Sporocytophaga sp. TaxID=2231183 RepID=UPI001AFCF9FD|nr:hypothetical protein [Sporocytophaga sp.]MBO9703774.1 hypothetical protein [Sporocytophaga sp.]